MRKQTAPRTRKRRQAPPPQPSGLMARDKSVPQSATPRSTLANHSHRTLIERIALKLRGAAAAIKRESFPFGRPPHADSFKRCSLPGPHFLVARPPRGSDRVWARLAVPQPRGDRECSEAMGEG